MKTARTVIRLSVGVFLRVLSWSLWFVSGLLSLSARIVSRKGAERGRIAMCLWLYNAFGVGRSRSSVIAITEAGSGQIRLFTVRPY